MKKLFAILAALMLLACAALPAMAENNMVGAWNISTETEMPAEAMDALNKAKEGFVGSNIEPMALLGTQIVAGTNYAFLCEITPVVPNPVPSIGIVTVWAKLDGTAEITDIQSLASVNDIAGLLGIPTDHAYMMDDDCNVYDLFEVRSVKLDANNKATAIQGNFARFAIVDGYEATMPYPESITIELAPDCSFFLINEELDPVPEADLAAWCARNFGDGKTFNADDTFFTVEVVRNEQGQACKLTGVYTPW